MDLPKFGLTIEDIARHIDGYGSMFSISINGNVCNSDNFRDYCTSDTLLVIVHQNNSIEEMYYINPQINVSFIYYHRGDYGSSVITLIVDIIRSFKIFIRSSGKWVVDPDVVPKLMNVIDTYMTSMSELNGLLIGLMGPTKS